MKKPDVSIIIVNYNVKEFILKCLASIYLTKGNLIIETIVIDNSSNDGSASSIREIFPQVIIIENNINAGFPAANNQGLKIAEGEYIFLLNPDTELMDDSVSGLKNFMDSDKKIEMVVPQLLNTDRTVQKSVFRFPRIRYILSEMFYLEKLFRSKYYGEKDLSKNFEVESASGAALFFRRSLINKIGMLNEKLFWIEDIDFCFRAIQAGGKILYFPDQKIIHHSGQSAKKNYNVSISNQIINKIKFFKIHGNRMQLFIVRIISLLNVLMRTIVFGLLSPFRKIYFLKLKAYVFTLPGIFTATKGL